MREHFLGRLTEAGQRIDRQAEAGHRLDCAELRLGERLADLAPGVGEKGERTPRGDARIELAQRTGGGVARIGEGRLARRGLPGVQRGEIGMAHVDFAARLENARRALQAVRDRLDRAHVGGDVLALEAVAARRRLDELAVFVAQIARQAVDLRLGRQGERRVRPCPESGAPGRRIPRPPRRRKYCRATASARRAGPWRISPTAARRPCGWPSPRRRAREKPLPGPCSGGAIRHIRRPKSSARPRRDSGGHARRSRRRAGRVRRAPWRGSGWAGASSSWAEG